MADGTSLPPTATSRVRLSPASCACRICLSRRDEGHPPAFDHNFYSRRDFERMLEAGKTWEEWLFREVHWDAFESRAFQAEARRARERGVDHAVINAAAIRLFNTNPSAGRTTVRRTIRYYERFKF